MRGGAILLLLGSGCVEGKDVGDDEPAGQDEDSPIEVDESGEGGDETAGDSEDEVIPDVTATVCDVGADFTSIQAAVDAVPDGWIVEVCPGTWREEPDLSGRRIVLRGAEGPAATILHGDGEGPVVTVGGGAAVGLAGFTLTGGLSELGGGVQCQASVLDLSDLVVEGNTAAQGAGLGAVDCDLTSTRSTWRSNTAYNDGGGVFLSDTTAVIEDDVFASNTAWHGGGVMSWYGEVEIRGSEVRDNLSQGLGGGIEIWGPGVVADCIVTRNSAFYTGGGLHLQDWSGDVVDNEITENLTEDADGGGVFIGDTASGVFARNVVTGNIAALDDAGGLRVFRAAITIADNDFSFNYAAGDGGGIKISHVSSEIVRNVFEGNTSEGAGGGLEVDDNNSYLGGNTIIGNTASTGGGVHYNEPFYEALMEDSLIQDNVASGCGGGITVDKWLSDDHLEPFEVYWPVELRHVVVQGNQANDGGGICQLQSEVRLVNSVVWGNTADGRGGGVFGEDGGARLTNSVVYGNQGGGLVITEASIASTNSIVASNAGVGVSQSGLGSVSGWTSNDVWGHDSDYSGGDPTGNDGNIATDPKFVNAAAGDFHLAAGSPCIDAGASTTRDADGSAADMGIYGGPGGDW